MENPCFMLSSRMKHLKRKVDIDRLAQINPKLYFEIIKNRLNLILNSAERFFMLIKIVSPSLTPDGAIECLLSRTYSVISYDPYDTSVTNIRATVKLLHTTRM